MIINNRAKKIPTCKGRDREIRRRHTLPHGCVVPSALEGLTSLFGMGRGGHLR